jgi:hypothetical protein
MFKYLKKLFFIVPAENGSSKTYKSKEFVDTEDDLSEGEDSTMSDEEEENETFDEEEVETSEDEGEAIDDTDSGDDESPPVRSESNTSRSVKHRSTKEDAKGKALKRKAAVDEKVQDGKVKKRKTDAKKIVKTVATVARKKTEMKKSKNDVKKDVTDGEVQAKPVDPLQADSPGEKNKKSYPTFEDKNLDYDYAANSPSNIIQRRVKIATNIILTCKNVEIVSNGQPMDIASLSFSRKTKNGKAFDYNMPLSLAPILIRGLQTIIRDNAKFFDSVGKDPN